MTLSSMSSFRFSSMSCSSPASLDTPSDDDEVQGDDWSDFELALGLAPGWEDEP